MKFCIHPPLTNTFIRHKDGSSYIKYWGYLRPTIILEVGNDSKKWEINNSIKSRKIFSLSFANQNITKIIENQIQQPQIYEIQEANNNFKINKLVNSSNWLNN